MIHTCVGEWEDTSISCAGGAGVWYSGEQARHPVGWQGQAGGDDAEDEEGAHARIVDTDCMAGIHL